MSSATRIVGTILARSKRQGGHLEQMKARQARRRRPMKRVARAKTRRERRRRRSHLVGESEDS